MKHSNAVMLWNSLCQINKEQCEEITSFGIAALAKDAPLWLSEVSEWTKSHRDAPSSADILKRANAVASFLREWADAIENDKCLLIGS
jgi:hypothetical protein